MLCSIRHRVSFQHKRVLSENLAREVLVRQLQESWTGYLGKLYFFVRDATPPTQRLECHSQEERQVAPSL